MWLWSTKWVIRVNLSKLRFIYHMNKQDSHWCMVCYDRTIFGWNKTIWKSGIWGSKKKSKCWKIPFKVVQMKSLAMHTTNQLCVCICMCICIWVYIYIYVCVYVCMYMCVCVYICMYMCVYVCICMCVCICICLCMYVCVYIYIYVYVCVCMCVCIYIYIYMYVCVYVFYIHF